MGELLHEAGATSAQRRRTWMILSLLIIAHVVFNLLLNPFFFVSANTRWLYLFLGATVMEPILLGLWAAVGPGKMTVRLPFLLALLLLVALAGSVKRWNFLLNGYLGAASTTAFFHFDFETLLGLFGLFVVSALVAREFGRLTGCRFVRGSGNSTGASNGIQYSVKYLLIVMTVFAAVLAVGRIIVFSIPGQQATSWSRLVGSFVISPIVIEILLLPSIALSVIALRNRVSLRMLVVVLVVAAVASLAIAEIGAALTSATQTKTLAVLCSIQAGAAIAGLFTAIPLRFVGYRLVSESTPSASKNNYLSERSL